MNLKYSLPLLALSFANFASADTDLFLGLDTNQDSEISKREAAVLPIVTNVWDELDVNQDGVLSHEEFAKLDETVQPENPENSEVAE